MRQIREIDRAFTQPNSTVGQLSEATEINMRPTLVLPDWLDTDKTDKTDGKHDAQFQCREALSSPETKCSMAELASGFNLQPSSEKRRTRKTTRATKPSIKAETEVWVPRPSDNRVLATLKSSGLYKSDLGQGKHDVSCPWLSEHTDSVDRGTAYFEPDDRRPTGGFKCLHGHCADKRLRHLLEFLGLEPAAARMKSTIRVVPGELDQVVEAAERELAQLGGYFQRGGQIVSIVTDPGTRETQIQAVSSPELLRALGRAATWERYDQRSEGFVVIDPPARHASVLYDSAGYRYLPVLTGLARQPYFRPDGSLVTSEGYDQPTGKFGVFDSMEFKIPESPTAQDVAAALALLEGVISEFCFRSLRDKTAALAALITAAIRPSLPVAPMFHVRAHMVGSGKSCLCAVISALATPQRGTPTTFPGDNEECRKLLLAELMRAPAVIEFDNVTNDLIAHTSLCTALSSEHLSGRILGESKTVAVSTRTLFLSSGNNVGPVADMTRRCITINLDPGCEIPAARTFKRPNLVDEVLSDRGRYVAAVLTIVWAYILAGKPRVESRSMAGFSDWMELCCGPLLWLGLSDPTESAFEAMTEDPDRELLDRLLNLWFARFGSTAAMVRDAIRLSQGDYLYEELHETLLDIAGERGEINRRKLGRWIKRNSGRIIGDKRFVRGAAKGASEMWRVELVSSVSLVSGDPEPEIVRTGGTDTRAALDYKRASRGL